MKKIVALSHLWLSIYNLCFVSYSEPCDIWAGLVIPIRLLSLPWYMPKYMAGV